MSKSVARGRQTTGGILSIVFYLYSPEGAACLAISAENRKFVPTPLSFSALVWGDPFQIFGKALCSLKLESSRQPMVKIW